MECPHCGLLDPPTAMRCDCGWDFESSTMKDSVLIGRSSAATQLPIIWVGFVIAAAHFTPPPGITTRSKPPGLE